MDKVCVYAMVDDRGPMSLIICRGHNTASKGALQIFL